MKYFIIIFTALLMNSCYTIMNQPSVIPDPVQGQILDPGDHYDQSTDIENNYYLWNGYYYNHPFYQDRRHLRYDWFTDSYYYDPYYYDYNYFYDDNRWYYHNYFNPYYRSNYYFNGSSGDSDEKKVRRDKGFGRPPLSTNPSTGTSIIGNDLPYVISGSSTTGSSSSSSKSSDSPKTITVSKKTSSSSGASHVKKTSGSSGKEMNVSTKTNSKSSGTKTKHSDNEKRSKKRKR